MSEHYQRARCDCQECTGIRAYGQFWHLHRREQDMTSSPWRPMDSAPLDGTPILLFLRWRCQIGAWLPYFDRSYPMAWQDPIAGGVLVREWKDDPEPTHWQPLPQPPGKP